jgi:predicted DNA-binding protein (MmcQ/YjbR family)
MKYATVARYCASLPHAVAERKWGNVLTYLVACKMFAVLTLDDRDRPTDLWLKADPERFLELTDQPGIRPAPYLGRAKWIALAESAAPDAAARALARRSYDLVFARLPRRVQRVLAGEDTHPGARA